MSISNSLPTILVVDDEESFIEALQVGLKREGFRIEVARDGAEALAMFDAVKPDAVLLDVMLPKVGGTDVCREIRKKSSVPIIMVSAKGSEIDTVVGLEVARMTTSSSRIAFVNWLLGCVPHFVVENCRSLKLI